MPRPRAHRGARKLLKAIRRAARMYEGGSKARVRLRGHIRVDADGEWTIGGGANVPAISGTVVGAELQASDSSQWKSDELIEFEVELDGHIRGDLRAP